MLKLSYRSQHVYFVHSNKAQAKLLRGAREMYVLSELCMQIRLDFVRAIGIKRLC